MRPLYPPRRPVLVLLLLPLLLSCAETKHWVSSKDITAPWSSTDEVTDSSAQTAKRAEKQRAAGEYQKAIDIYQEAYQKEPEDQTLVDAYVKSLEQMIAAADKAYDRQEFASAGKTYDILLKNEVHFSGFKKKLSFNRTRLKAKRDDCRKVLYRQGFQAYRNGNLDEAIAKWQDLLIVDPHNTDIQEALRTAKLQQKNLREQE